MKKLKLLLLLSIIVLTFSSCISTDTEIKNRLIVEGIGIDYDAENNKYILTVQALTTASAGSDDSNGSSTPVTNYTVSDKTIAGAFDALCKNTGKSPLYSQNRIIIIGDTLGYDNIAASLDYLVRENTARPDVYVAAADGSAEDILKTQSGGEIPAKTIEESITQSCESSVTKSTQLYNIVNLYSEKTSAITMPLVKIDDSVSSQGEAVKVSGVCAITKNGQKNHLSESETVIVNFVTDNINSGTLSVALDGQYAAADIIKSKTKLKITLDDGNVNIQTDIKCTVDLVEYSSPDFGSIDETDISKIEKATERYIASGIKEVFSRELKDEKCDIFRLSKHLELSFPDIYSELKENWEEALADFTFEVNVDVVIRKTGQETLRNY